jgi:hypothetical protein
MSIWSSAPIGATAVLEGSTASGLASPDSDELGERADLLAYRRARRRARTRRMVTGLAGLAALLGAVAGDRDHPG